MVRTRSTSTRKDLCVLGSTPQAVISMRELTACRLPFTRWWISRSKASFSSSASARRACASFLAVMSDTRAIDPMTSPFGPYTGEPLMDTQITFPSGRTNRVSYVSLIPWRIRAVVDLMTSLSSSGANTSYPTRPRSSSLLLPTSSQNRSFTNWMRSSRSDWMSPSARLSTSRLYRSSPTRASSCAVFSAVMSRITHRTLSFPKGTMRASKCLACHASGSSYSRTWRA